MSSEPKPITPASQVAGDRGLARRWPDVLSALLFVVLIVLAIATHRDYGITWDERSHQQYGDYVVSVLSDLLHGELPDKHPRWGRYPYGGAYDGLGAIARRLLPWPKHDTLHLLSALTGILGIAGTWWLARLLAGPWAAFAAAVLLTTVPAYFGHMFNNPKDVPFAVGYIWALASICALIQTLPTVRRRHWLAVTLGCGLAICVRPVGGIVVAYLVFVLALFSLRQGLVEQNFGAVWRSLRYWLTRCFGVALGAWACLVAFFPAALLQPFSEPMQAAQQLSYYRRFVPIMRFDGEVITSFEVPWSYLPTYLLIKLPELHLLILVTAIGLGVPWIGSRRSWRQWLDSDRRAACFGVLLMAVLTPPTLAVLMGSALYDGLRHFLFLLPPLAVIGGVTVQQLWHRGSWRWLLAPALLLLCADVVHTMTVLHPHQYVYFNRLVGGLPGAAEGFETDYYGNSHRRVFEGLTQTLWQKDPDAFLNTEFVIDGCLSRYAASRYMPANMRLVPPPSSSVDPNNETPSEADFYLADRRLFCTEFLQDRPTIYRVERFDTTLSLFQDLRNP